MISRVTPRGSASALIADDFLFGGRPTDRSRSLKALLKWSLRFVPRAEIEAEGHGAYLDQVEEVR